MQPAITARPSAGALFSIGGRQLLVALRYLLLMTVVLGIAYPLVVLGIGQLAANNSANGSQVTDSAGAVVGSALIGQQFDGPALVRRPAVRRGRRLRRHVLRRVQPGR